MGLLSTWLDLDDTLALRGARTELRVPHLRDFEAWRDLRVESRSHLEPWEPSWDERDLTKSHFRDRLAQYKSMAEQDLAHSLYIFRLEDQRLCGAITLSNIRRGIAQMGTLGYWTGAPFARQGLMTDALQTMIVHGFADLGLHRLEAACLPHNAASIRLLTKCGFQQEGRASRYLKIAGRWEDHLLFGKVNQASR